MDANPSELRINIRPGVKILSVLSHLNYKPWFAVAEFVDNSIQSYLDNCDEIRRYEGDDFKLRVAIDLELNDGGRLTIRDNAAGIHTSDYRRAFRPAAIPSNRTGLSEFGMGMKSAACWFSPYWTVRTSALGEPIERVVTFDVAKIVEDELEELSVKSSSVPVHHHYTTIYLAQLYKPPQKKTTAKIKDHLASIYRIFIKNNQLELVFNNDVLDFETPRILNAPRYSDRTAESSEWRKDIDFDFGDGLRATGFAALRERASIVEAGFALFRRNRVIQGSGDETYRPHYIFGQPNSFRYQRLFGELHVEGFEVSHTKDGFKWDENEQAFLELLKEHLDSEPIPLLKQAERFPYRDLQKTRDLRAAAEESTENVAHAVRENIPEIVERQIVDKPVYEPPPSDLTGSSEVVAQKTLHIEVFDTSWEISLELSNDASILDWVSYSESSILKRVRQLNIRLSLAHPFMLQFGGISVDRIEPLQRLAVAIVLSEITARESGVKSAGTFRRNINELLRDALATP